MLYTYAGCSHKAGKTFSHSLFSINFTNVHQQSLSLDSLQMELQEMEPHMGITTSSAQDACRLLKAMVAASWNGTHTCSDRSECMYCESCVMWYQLALQLVKFLSPENPAHPPDVSILHAPS